MLVCGEDGFAQSKALPYGEYVVEQIKGWDGRELMPAFTVQISEHGKTYQYLINNAEFKAYLKIVKVDAETRKNIPYAGAAFEIYDPDGKLVEMTTTYPQPETHGADPVQDLCRSSDPAAERGISLCSARGRKPVRCAI